MMVHVSGSNTRPCVKGGSLDVLSMWSCITAYLSTSGRSVITNSPNSVHKILLSYEACI